MGVDLERFVERLHSEWLPAFCGDPKRQYDPSGFKYDSVKVTDLDAKDFLRAFDAGLITDLGGGRYRCVMSKASEQLFWTGAKGITPRPLTLWIEPIITIASVARLHLDYCWPAELLGMQSADWAFDFGAYREHPAGSMIIAGEAKKSVAEVENLVHDLHAYSRTRATVPASDNARHINSFKKWTSLRRSEASLFWAVAPDGISRLFELHHSAESAELSEAPLDALDASTHIGG